MAVKETLREQAITVIVATSFGEAVRVLRSQTVDVMIVDARHESSEGASLIETAQGLPDRVTTILMTPAASARDAEAALDQGVAGILDKPFNPDDLTSALNRILEGESVRGDLSGVSLLDLFQVFNLSRRSLVIRVGGVPPSRVWFENGEIIHAECGDLQGERVLERLVDVRTGAIRTLPFSPAPRSVDRPFHSLLLDILRAQDEARRTDGPAPEEDEIWELNDEDLSEVDGTIVAPAIDDDSLHSNKEQPSPAVSARPSVLEPSEQGALLQEDIGTLAAREVDARATEQLRAMEEETGGAESNKSEPGDRAADRSASPATDRAADRAVDPVADRAVDRVADRVADRAVDRVADRAADRVADRAANGQAAGSTFESALEPTDRGGAPPVGSPTPVGSIPSAVAGDSSSSAAADPTSDFQIVTTQAAGAGRTLAWSGKVLSQRLHDPICRAITAEIPFALATALVDLTSGKLLGLDNTADFSPAFERFISLYVRELFRGPEIQHIERTVQEQRGMQGRTGFLEEIVLTSRHTHHLVKVLHEGKVAIMVVTPRRVSIQTTWTKLRSLLPGVETNLAQTGA